MKYLPKQSFPKQSLPKTLLTLAIAVILWSLSNLVALPAWAVTPIKLSNVAYHACPPELAAGTVTTRNSQPASCFILTATAQNDSGKTVYDADVFGRIYDANGDTVFENRGRVGTVEEIPVGNSEVSLRVTIASTQPEPFSLKQFKATGYNQKIRQ